MKRRRFVQGLFTVPAVMAIEPALMFAQRGGRGGAAPAPPPEFPYSTPDEVGRTVLSFFTPDQFRAMERLGEILMPAIDGDPGAAQTDAVEFLDFLLSVSRSEAQQLYRQGLDTLNDRARAGHGRLFADLETPDAEVLLEPLSRPWSYRPADPFERFLREARSALRTATENSPAFAQATGNTRSTRYLLPL